MDAFVTRRVRRPQPGTIEFAIHEAVRAATPADQRFRWSAETIARDVIAKNGQIVQVWTFQRITTLVRAELRARPDPNQMFLPGFKDLSRRLPIEAGFVRLGLATISDLRSAARTLREQNKRKVTPKAARLQRLIAMMEPYAARHHGLTVAQFFGMRARRGSAAAPAAAPATTATGNQMAAGCSA